MYRLVGLWLLVFLVTGHWSLATDLWACPGCKEALFDPGQLPQRLSTAKGYALSIALLLGTPLALIGGITALIMRHRRRG